MILAKVPSFCERDKVPLYCPVHENYLHSILNYELSCGSFGSSRVSLNSEVQVSDVVLTITCHKGFKSDEMGKAITSLYD